MNAIDQQRVANTQRGYLMAILFFFLFFSANDFTPAKTRRNANTGIAGVNKASAETSRRRDEVRDKVIIDLSESNAALEVENRKLRASLIGMREALRKRAGDDDIKNFDLAYNLTHLLGVATSATPQLEGRDIVSARHNPDGDQDVAENDIPSVSKARKVLRT
uniref:Uncharacterized protein n=1 Tax=Ostreococcus mediterraneus TaxID=1486918 RepID=A0A6U0E2N2_9CHLO|mmetsp:Transcript_3891/g.14114  ORF Transcript_3891/g.14114 Transcript_3891/m.14114 type:complete len:163 (+) Transcript_3891:147-635(+)